MRSIALAFIVSLLGCVIMFALSTIGHAATRHHHYRPHRAVYDSGTVTGHPAGCPGTAFCGCGTSVRVFGHPVRDLYLAANWYRFPRAGVAPGNVAIFGQHHVAYIESVVGGDVVVLYDPNSGGHLTRIHQASVSGATIVNPRGGSYASNSDRGIRSRSASVHYGEPGIRVAASGGDRPDTH